MHMRWRASLAAFSRYANMSPGALRTMATYKTGIHVQDRDTRTRPGMMVNDGGVEGAVERRGPPGLRRVPDLAWFVRYTADEAASHGL